MPNPYLDDDQQAYDREARIERPIPAGFRALSAEEGERLEAGMSLLVFDRGERCITRWIVLGYRDGKGWRVARGSRDEGDTLWLDDDDPNFWADDEHREQRGPQTENGAFVAVVPIDLDDLEPLLRESLYPVVARDVLEDARILRLVR